MSFLFHTGPYVERDLKSCLSDYCIVHLLNALLDYFSSLLLSDRDCESQLHCESD
jgi:hypothetical protein